ncbi:MAG: ATP synthase F1 subunit epsilon [Chloroflexi bacterium]|nr:ATP synthase F1 subunit epsilon [Chloroflexota bacterium]
MPIQCQIITQEREVFDEDVDIVLAPAVQGQVAILPQHAPLVTALAFGEVLVRQGEKETAFAVGGGVLQVTPSKVIVLADSADQAQEIDVEAAEEARRRAEELMREGAPADPEEYASLQAAMLRAKLQLKVARRHRPRSGTGPRAMDFSE